MNPTEAPLERKTFDYVLFMTGRRVWNCEFLHRGRKRLQARRKRIHVFRGMRGGGFQRFVSMFVSL